MNQKQFKIGRLRFTIARKINRKCADIYLTPNYLKHIERRHKTELAKLGLSAFDFVITIVKGFNQIREGSGDSILLVIFNGDLNYTAGIDLCLSGDHWKVKTAEPRKTEDIEKENFYGKNSTRFRRIAAVHLLKHLRPYRRFV